MADIKLDDLGDGGDRPHIFVIEAMTGMHFETQLVGFPGRALKAFKLFLSLGRSGFAISSGVQFHGRRAAGNRLPLPA